MRRTVSITYCNVNNTQSGVNLGVGLKGLNGSEWGMELESYDFDMIRSGGFHYVRVPVCFLPYLSEEGGAYRLDDDLLRPLDAVLNGILSRGMIAILDFHCLLQEEQYAFESRTAGQENQRQFLAVWDIVARRYAGYPPELYFELVNEPRKPIMPADWNVYVDKALALIRSSGGNNGERTIVVGGECPDRPSDAELGQHERQKALVRRDFDLISAWARENGRQVILGELGVSVFADIVSQVNWTRFVREEAEARGMIWLLWQFFYEYGGDTLGGLYDRSAGFWRSEILDALQPGEPSASSDPRAVEPAAAFASDEETLHTARELAARLRDPEWTARRDAAQALAGMAREAALAVSALVEALEDEEWQVRDSAAAALAAMRPAPPAATPALTDALRDAEWQVRESAALALARQGSAAESALAEVIELLGDVEWRVRRMAAVALSVIAPASEEVVQALEGRLDDPEGKVGETAAAVLRDLGVTVASHSSRWMSALRATTTP